MLIAAAQRNGYQPIECAGFRRSSSGAFTPRWRRPRRRGSIALINSGGAVLGMGTCLDAYRLPSGMVRGTLPCRSGVTGLVHDFAGRGVPVIHILNIKRLALDWGLPLRPGAASGDRRKPASLSPHASVGWVALARLDLSQNVGLGRALARPNTPTAEAEVDDSRRLGFRGHGRVFAVASFAAALAVAD